MKTKLFVSSLSRDVDEDALLRHIESIDRTIRVKLVNLFKDNYSGICKGFGTIEVESEEDAVKMLDKVNFSLLYNNEIKLSWFKPGGIKDKISGNLFVKNLPSTTRSKELFDFFAKFGSIISCCVKYTSNGMSCKGYGYVMYDSAEVADKAIDATNNQEFKGNKLEVFHFKAREKRETGVSYNNLFVKFIPKTYTNEDIIKLFSDCGEIISAVVIKEKPEDTVNKGFGFVCFKNSEEAKAAENKLMGFSLEGQKLFVCKALSKENRRKQMQEERMKIFKDCNLFVKEISDGITDESLKKEFERFGEVVSAKVMMDRHVDSATGAMEMKPKGFGFVCFKTKEDAAKAVAASHQTDILGKRMYVAIAQKKEDRLARARQNMYAFTPEMMPPPMMQPFRGRRARGGNRRMRPDDMFMYPYPPMMMGPMGHMGPMGQMGPMGPMGPMGSMGPMPMSPMPAPVFPHQMQAHVPTPAPPVAEPAFTGELSNDKEQLGETLYSLVEKENPDNAAKITGMLLEIDITQIHNIIKDPQQLKKWISEAMSVLHSSSGNQ